jgi:hypothetical protein
LLLCYLDIWAAIAARGKDLTLTPSAPLKVEGNSGKGTFYPKDTQQYVRIERFG